MELQKILNIFEEHGFNENNCSFFRQEDITDIAKEVKEAINYNRCSTQLKDKEAIVPEIKSLGDLKRAYPEGKMHTVKGYGKLILYFVDGEEVHVRHL